MHPGWVIEGRIRMRNREKMTMGVASMVVGMIGLTVGVAGQEPDGNLIINGSFEDSPDVDGYHSLDEGSDAIKGWVVTRGQIDLIGARHWKAAAGKKSVDLNGSPGFGGIKQSFTTQKGHRYCVQFQMAATPATYGGDGKVKLLVRAAGEKEAFSADATDNPSPEIRWTRKKWTFTAADDTTTLEIYSLDRDDGNCGPAIDDVSVTEVKDKANG
jgi:choice-of-anchor C domain-containing protein